MARNGVTYKAVSECAEKLLSSGIQPTVALIKETMGIGSKAAIQRHLERWRKFDLPDSHHMPNNQASHQNNSLIEPRQGKARVQDNIDTSNQNLSHYSAQNSSAHNNSTQSEELPDALMALIKNFWSSLNDTSEEKNDVDESAGSTKQQSEVDAQLQEHVALIQEYVSGLEKELAETTAIKNRLAQRLKSLYQLENKECAVKSNDSAYETPEQKYDYGSDTLTTALADPQLTPTPLLQELEAIQAGLSTKVSSQQQTEAEDDTTQALDHRLSACAAQGWLDKLDTQEKAQNGQLRTACRFLSAALVREQSLNQDNSALLKQMRFLQNKVSKRTQNS